MKYLWNTYVIISLINIKYTETTTDCMKETKS